MQADEHTLYDLIATIDAHRRSLDAAALRPGDPSRSAHYRRRSHSEAMTVAKIRRMLAQHGGHGSTISRRELEACVDSLIDAYTDDAIDDTRGPMHRPSTRQHHRADQGNRNCPT